MTTSATRVDIEQKPIDDIAPADYNPRIDLQPHDREYRQLKASLTAYGQITPLVYNQRTQRLVAGHQRLTVMRDLGWTDAWVALIDVPEHREKAVNVALNRIDGRWDDSKLADIVAHATQDENIDLDVIGFTPREADNLIHAVERANQAAADAVDQAEHDDPAAELPEPDAPATHPDAPGPDATDPDTDANELLDEEDDAEQAARHEEATDEADARTQDAKADPNEHAPDWYRLTYSVHRDDRRLVVGALRRAQAEYGADTHAQALHTMLTAHRDGRWPWNDPDSEQEEPT